MSFESREISALQGAPIELYRFARGATVWRYTSAEKDVVFDGHTWTSQPLTRSSIEQTPERPKNNLTVTGPRNLPIADIFRVTSPTDVISLTLLGTHRGETESVVLWMGRLLNVMWKGAAAELMCEPVSTSLRRQGLRRLYQRQCPLVLYSCNCGVSRGMFSHVTNVAAVSGTSLTVDSLMDNGESEPVLLPYGGGYIDWTQPDGNVERRFIRSHVGTQLVLSHPFQDIAVTDEVTVYPGCDHTTATCSGVFNNLPNYGGYPYIPRKNPFDGTPIY